MIRKMISNTQRIPRPVVIALIATGVLTLVALAAIRAPPIATRMVTKRTMSMNPNDSHALKLTEALPKPVSADSPNHLKTNMMIRSTSADAAAIVSPLLSLAVSTITPRFWRPGRASL